MFIKRKISELVNVSLLSTLQSVEYLIAVNNSNMRSFLIVFVTLLVSLCVSCDPIVLLNKDKTQSSMAIKSLEKQLEADAEMKNVPNLHLPEEVERLMEPAVVLTDDESSKKRAARQVVVTASFPYVFTPYVYYPSVYTSSINYYRAAIFPFLGI